ncbi:hypothetical protein RB195_014990 [Necator americanus]
MEYQESSFACLMIRINEQLLQLEPHAGCTTPSEVATRVRQEPVAGTLLFNLAIDDIMRRTVDQCPADIILAPSGRPLTDLEYADDVVVYCGKQSKTVTCYQPVELCSKTAYLDEDAGNRVRQ